MMKVARFQSVFVLWMATACGASVDDDPRLAAVTHACEEAETLECALYDSCESGLTTTIYGSQSNCVSRRTRACILRALSPGASIGATDITTCTDNQAAQSCDEWVGRLTPGCGFVGTKANGENCRDNVQCASGFCDQVLYYTESDVCGVCAAPPIEGQPCHSSCGRDESLACVHFGQDAGQCLRVPGDGEACDVNRRCGVGFQCATPRGTTTGVCMPANGKIGDACDIENGPMCDVYERIYCNQSTHTCEPARVVELGEACGLLSDGSTGVCAQSACVSSVSGATIGTCVAYAADGDRCTFGPGSTVRCQPPAICANGACRIVGGELCE